MFRLIQSRLVNYLTKNNNKNIINKSRLCSFSSSSTVSRFSTKEKSIHTFASKKKPIILSFLKFGIFSAFLGTTATAGYVTYSYTADQVDELTKEFRRSVNTITVEPDASAVEKYHALRFYYSAAMKVPAKCIETYSDLRRLIEEKIQVFVLDSTSDKLLPDMSPKLQKIGVKTLVLDLDETLVGLTWTRKSGLRSMKIRPGLDVFLDRISMFYEVVIYTDMKDREVTQIFKVLNEGNWISYVLSRHDTKYHDGKHYRDLSKLNRDPSRVIYISGHALKNALQPENCVPIKPWKFEEDDRALIDLLPFLEFVARQGLACPDVRQVLASYKGCDIPTEFTKRRREVEKRKSARHF